MAKSAFLTLGYRGGHIHTHYEDKKEHISAQYRDARKEGFKSIRSAEAWIRKMAKESSNGTL